MQANINAINDAFNIFLKACLEFFIPDQGIIIRQKGDEVSQSNDYRALLSCFTEGDISPDLNQ